MKKLTLMIWASVLLATGAVLQSGAAVPGSITSHTPGVMNYQGRLVGPTGIPYADATYSFDIRLWTDANLGTALWGGTYASFVKDGYFSIMLGTPGGALLTDTTYAPDALWKALWPDPSGPGGASDQPLYLGVTPWQGTNGSLLDAASRVEFLPRQALLTTPYAFRAQTAGYANQAVGNFVVGGNLIVTNASMVRGSGQLQWGVPGGVTPEPPMRMILKKVKMTYSTFESELTWDSNVYAVMLVGVEPVGGSSGQLLYDAHLEIAPSQKWKIVLKKSTETTYWVYLHLLIINKNWMAP